LHQLPDLQHDTGTSHIDITLTLFRSFNEANIINKNSHDQVKLND